MSQHQMPQISTEQKTTAASSGPDQTPPPKKQEEKEEKESPETELKRSPKHSLREVVQKFLITHNIFIPIAARRIPDPLDEFEAEYMHDSRVRYPHLELGRHLRYPKKKDLKGKIVKDKRSPFDNWNAVEFASFYELNADLIAHHFLYLYQCEMLECSAKIRAFIFARSLHIAVKRDPSMLSEDHANRLGMRIIKGILRHLLARPGETVSFDDTEFRPARGSIWDMSKRSYELMIFNPKTLEDASKTETIEPGLLPSPDKLDFPAYLTSRPPN